ncbi:hypothetical protein [Pseudomonas sp.]|uniref:hypothetical protein n=1 Tax=Pseudomonas sp. TaxID=306 RepID=UPI002FC65F0D
MKGFQDSLIKLYKAEGLHIAYEFTGRMDIAQFTRYLRDVFVKREQRKGIAIPKYDYLWFSTENGFMFYATGEEVFIDSFVKAATRYTTRQKLEAERVYSGQSKELFMLRVSRDLSKFSPRKELRLRSYGARAQM